MYAIIQSGSKQYRVDKGATIDIDALDHKEGDKISFEKVLLFSDGSKVEVGAPFVKGCSVKATYVEKVNGPKEIAFKYKRRKSCHRKVGHRQHYSRFKITSITLKKEKEEEKDGA